MTAVHTKIVEYPRMIRASENYQIRVKSTISQSGVLVVLVPKKEKTKKKYSLKTRKPHHTGIGQCYLCIPFRPTHTHTPHAGTRPTKLYSPFLRRLFYTWNIFSSLARFSCVWRAAQKCLLRSIIVAQAGYFRFTWPNSDSFFSFFLRVLWIKCAGMHLFHNTLHAHTTAHSIEFQFWCRIFRFIFVVVALGV